ncbi:MAG: class I SAM-dependent methyltransferase [Burkholderiales bacterium]
MALRGPALGTAVGPLAAAFLDALQPRAGADETAWYAGHVGAALALDVMCGAGRLMIPLLERGLKVHGVDASAAMIARCEEKLASHALAGTLFRQDAVALNVPFRYGAAFVAGSAFDAISDPAAAMQALSRLRAHLVEPGTLVVACHVPDLALQRLAAPLVEVRTARLDDDSQIVLRSETTWTQETRSMRAQQRYTHRRGTQRIAEESATVRETWYAPADIVELVRAAGFRDASTTALPFALHSRGESFALIARA